MHEVFNSKNIRTQPSFKCFTKKYIQPICVSIRQLPGKSWEGVCDNRQNYSSENTVTSGVGGIVVEL